MHRRVKVSIAIAIAMAIALSLAVPAMLSFGRFSVAPPKVGNNANGNPSAPSVITFGPNGAKTFAELFRVIKSMTVEFNFTQNGASSSERISYSAGMAIMDDGRPAYKVNLTDITPGENGSDSESALVWVDSSSGNILQVTMGGICWTGDGAQGESGIISFITTDYWLSLLNSSTVSQTEANHSVSLGMTQLYSTTYEGLPSFPEFQDMVITVGSIPQSGMQLVLYAHYHVPGGGSGSFRVISLALNQ